MCGGVTPPAPRCRGRAGRYSPARGYVATGAGRWVEARRGAPPAPGRGERHHLAALPQCSSPNALQPGSPARPPGPPAPPPRQAQPHLLPSTLSRTCWPVMATAFAAGGDVSRPAAAATGAHLVVLAAAAATAAAVGVETLMVGVGFTFRCRACTVTGEALPCAGRAGWWGTHGAATDLCFQRGAARVAPAP